MTTLGDDLPKLMAHVRDEVMPAYQQIGPSGKFALVLMRTSLDRATKAMAEGDIAEMLAVYQELKNYKM